MKYSDEINKVNMKSSDNTVKDALKYPDSINKGDRGFLTIVCGSSRYRGAASLAVQSALRCGVGIVCLASTERVISSVSSKVDECIYLPMKESGIGSISASSVSEIISQSKTSAFLVGCGMINCSDTRDIAYKIIKNSSCPIILDADALNSLSDNSEVLLQARSEIAVTPHVGEMSRLIGKSIDEIKLNREQAALDFAKKYGVTVVLKDSTTVIASKDGRLYIHEAPNSGMAKGGSGDVLAGIIAALSAQGTELFTASKIGVIIHGRAGKTAAQELSKTSMLPSDIIKYIPNVIGELEKI